jgi:hypothetical protein
MSAKLYYSIFPTEHGVAVNIANSTQLVWFNDEMRPVEQVTELLLEAGKTPDWILRWLGFRLGLEVFNE